MVTRILLPVVITLLPLTSRAAVTVLDYYRFGDADPGASVGALFNSTTVDSAGANDLTMHGKIIYSSDVPAATIAGEPNRFAASFSGDASEEFRFPTRLTDAQDNFGLEMFVNSASLTGTLWLAYNGKFGSSGFGLVQQQSEYQAVLGSNPGTYFGGTPVSLDTWVHLALIRDGGISAFYVNGILSQTSDAVPLFGSNPFLIGSSTGNGFEGLIDEVRLFTFSPGEFTTKDLLVNQIPEPAGVALLTLGAAYLGSMRRRTGSRLGAE